MVSRLVALLVASIAAVPAVASPQTDLDAFANHLGVRLTILDNKPATCPKQSSGCFLSQLDLSVPNALASDLANGNFKIYFGSVSPVIDIDSDRFTVRLINGDLHVLEPRSNAHFKPGETYRIKLWSQGHFFSEYYVLPNMFVVSGNLAPRVIAATRPATDPESGLELLPFVAPMTDEARLGTASAGDETRWQTPEDAFRLFASRAVAAPPPETEIIPTPVSVRKLGGAAIDLNLGVRVEISGIDRAKLAAVLADVASQGVRESKGGALLSVRIGQSGLKPESYRIVAQNGTIAIDAADFAAAGYALQSLAQQAAHDGGRLQPIAIADGPRFPFRGLHVDLARNFHSKAEVLSLIRQMGRYKLNKLHLHLGDDEGWRLQVRKLPELTEVGAFRCFDPTESHCILPQLGSGPDRDAPVNGYLSQADYLEILKAAKERGIEVIPSFDMPGHSRAAIRSMEARYRRLLAAGRKSEAEEFRLVEPEDRTKYRSIQNYDDNTLNVCLESTYRFIDAVIVDLKALHAAAGTPLETYHIGADETAGAWSQSPTCKALMVKTGRNVEQLGPMFIERVASDLARKGIGVAGWSDGLGHVDPAHMPAKVQSNVWGDLFTAATAEAHRHANLGWRTVLGVPNVLYLDVPYAPNPRERGYDWPTRGTDSFKVFSFLPENLAANASLWKDIHNQPVTADDKTPLAPGRAIGGAQAQLWSETVRSDQIANYMLFPRLIAFAERAWSRADWETPYRPGAAYRFGDGQVNATSVQFDWNRFAAKLPEHLERLDRDGIFYRIAPPGARITAGRLEANSEFPGQLIEYRLGSGSWRPYRGPVTVEGPVQLRTLSYDRRRASRIVEVTAR